MKNPEIATALADLALCFNESMSDARLELFYREIVKVMKERKYTSEEVADKIRWFMDGGEFPSLAAIKRRCGAKVGIERAI